MSDSFKQFAKTLRCALQNITANHPQANGKTGRVHRTIITAFKGHAESNGGSWIKNLPWVLLGLRNAISIDIESPAQKNIWTRRTITR